MFQEESRIAAKSRKESVFFPSTRGKQKGTYSLSAGPISNPTLEVDNVFHDLLGLSVPKFLYHLCEGKPGNEWVGLSMLLDVHDFSKNAADMWVPPWGH